MSKTRFLTQAIVFAVALFVRPVAAEVVDRILATVDKEVILQSDILDAVAPEINQLRMAGASGEELGRKADALMREALDQAIEAKILLREALLAGYEVEDEAIEQHIDTIKQGFTSTEEFLRELDRAGLTVADLRERHRKQLLATNMAMAKRRQFARDAVISEADVLKYYEEHKSEFSRPERVWCRQIFLAARDDPHERTAARSALEKLKEEIVAGADFTELARSHSQAPGAENGGVIGWIAHGDLKPALEEAAFALPVDGISSIVETEGGLHLLKVEKKEEGGVRPFQEVRQDIEPRLRDEAAEERYNKWVGELRKRSRVRIVF